MARHQGWRARSGGQGYTIRPSETLGKIIIGHQHRAAKSTSCGAGSPAPMPGFRGIGSLYVGPVAGMRPIEPVPRLKAADLSGFNQDPRRNHEASRRMVAKVAADRSLHGCAATGKEGNRVLILGVPLIGSVPSERRGPMAGSGTRFSFSRSSPRSPLMMVSAGAVMTTTLLAALWPDSHHILDWRVLAAVAGLGLLARRQERPRPGSEPRRAFRSGPQSERSTSCREPLTARGMTWAAYGTELREATPHDMTIGADGTADGEQDTPPAVP